MTYNKVKDEDLTEAGRKSREYRAKAKEKKQKKEQAVQQDARFTELISNVLNEYTLPGERYKSELLIDTSLMKLYQEFAQGEEILRTELSFEQWRDLRDRCRKDLFYLCHDVLNRDLTSFTHQIVCDQFVQKNFDNVYKQGYSLDDVHEAFARQQRFDDKGNSTREM